MQTQKWIGAQHEHIERCMCVCIRSVEYVLCAEYTPINIDRHNITYYYYDYATQFLNH